MLQRRAGKLQWAGADLAAHCINDVATCGAEPLFFLDYIAANRVETELVAELVEGAAGICRAAGCALIGGETAELPGIYRDEEFDFAGTCVGLVERDDLIDGSTCEAGDVIVGFRSAGLHANGFTLVRSLIGDADFDADVLLPPTRLYLEEIRALRARADVRALAHITGGGIPGNLVRVLPEGLRAVIDRGPGRVAPPTTGSTPRASPRKSSAASSTSGSACARSSPRTRWARTTSSSAAWNAASARSSSRDRGPRLRKRDEPAGTDRRRAAD